MCIMIANVIDLFLFYLILTMIILHSDKVVYKSSIVAMANTCDKLSTDRLRRVQAVQESSKVSSLIPRSEDTFPQLTRKDVGLHSDIAYNSGCSYKLGRVSRMVKPAARGKIEYRNPINLDDDSSKNIEFHLVIYEKPENEDSGFRFKPGNIEIVKGKDILMNVNMSVNVENALMYTLESNDLKDLNDLVAQRLENRKKPKQRTPRASNPTPTATDSTPPNPIIQSDASGVIRMVVEPQANPDGLRRGLRVRTSKIYNS